MFILAFTLLTGFATSVHAWGPDAQTATAVIADQLLTPTAKRQISTILGGQTLGNVATWADTVRGQQQWAKTGPWHYINLPEKNKAQDPQDIVEAINFIKQQFQSSPQNEKIVWLKFLVHLVGDLHQPLHAGRASDRGGNQVIVSFRGRETNLHALWDSRMLNAHGLNSQAIVQRLSPRAAQLRQTIRTFEPQAVILENQELLDFVYSFQNGAISESYSSAAIVKIEDRIVRGGVRLANLLNALLSN